MRFSTSFVLGATGKRLAEIEIAFECFEFFGEFVDCLIAIFRRLRERFGQDSLQIKRKFRPIRRREARIAMQDRVHRVDAVVVNKRRRAGQHLA